MPTYFSATRRLVLTYQTGNTRLRIMPKKGPPPGPVARDKQISFYVTKEDAEFLNNISQGMGFKSRSVLVTAILEALIQGGFSGPAFWKLQLQIMKRLDKHGYPGQLDFSAILRPPPVLPDEEMTPEEIRAFISNLKSELKKKEKKNELSTTRNPKAKKPHKNQAGQRSTEAYSGA